jgi:hypothetical protein
MFDFMCLPHKSSAFLKGQFPGNPESNAQFAFYSTMQFNKINQLMNAMDL